MVEHDDDAYVADAYTTHPAPIRVVLYLVCLVLMLGGFWLMALGMDQDSGLLFGGGIVASGLAFALPMRESRD